MGCDGCDEWFHFDCIGIKEESVLDFESWFCKNCLKNGKTNTSSKRVKIKSHKVIDGKCNYPKQTFLDGFINRKSPKKRI